MAGTARFKIVKMAPGSAMTTALEPAVTNLANAIAKRMRRLVPKRSYRLHDTIEVQPAKSVAGKVTASVTFGGKITRGKLVDYHLMVERGTSKMAAQPFARPALYQSRSSDLGGK